jgi:Tfp pilus assembly protein PilN
MRAVNLLPRDDARTRRGLPSPWVMVAATAPVVAGCLVYVGYSVEHAKVVDKTAKLAAIQARLDRLTTAQSGLAAESGLVGLRGARMVALQDALSKSMVWDVTLQDLARVLPKGVSLTSLSAQSPTPAASAATTTGAPAPVPTTAPQTFNLVGLAATHDQVAELLERLSLLPMLTNVTLGSTSTVTVTAPAPAPTAASLGVTTTPTKPPPTQLQFTVTAGVVQPGQGAGQ